MLMANTDENSMSGGYLNSKTRMTVLEKSLFRLLCCGFVFFTLKKVHLTKTRHSIFCLMALFSLYSGPSVPPKQHVQHEWEQRCLLRVWSSERAPFAFKVLLLSISLIKLRVFEGDPEHCPSSCNVPPHPRPLPACPAAPGEQHQTLTAPPCPCSLPMIWVINATLHRNVLKSHRL